MTEPIENLRLAVESACGAVAGDVRARLPSVQYRWGSYGTETFVLRCQAVYSVQGPQHEDVVISVDVRRLSGGGAAITSDIALEDGQLLAQGPETLIDAIWSPEALRMTEKALSQFIRASESVFLPHLAELLENG